MPDPEFLLAAPRRGPRWRARVESAGVLEEPPYSWTPEAQLVIAIIVSQWRDATRSLRSRSARAAVEWFFSEDFVTFCDWLDFAPDMARQKLQALGLTPTHKETT